MPKKKQKKKKKTVCIIRMKRNRKRYEIYKNFVFFFFFVFSFQDMRPDWFYTVVEWIKTKKNGRENKSQEFEYGGAAKKGSNRMERFFTIIQLNDEQQQQPK